MKTYIHVAIGLLCTLNFACKKDELLSFNEKPKIYIYKNTLAPVSPVKDSVTYSFAIKPATIAIDTVFVPLRIIGKAENRDRKVNYEVMSTSTAIPESYTLLPATIKANSFEGRLAILVKKVPALKTKEEKLWLKVTASADFDLGVADQLSYLVKINDFLSKPPTWPDNFFGAYSNIKYDLIIKTTGYVAFNTQINEMRFVAQACKNALQIYEAQNGSPLLDELGNRVVFP